AGLPVLRRGGSRGSPRHALRRLPRQRRRGAGPGRCRRHPHRRRRGPLRPSEGEQLMSTGTTPSIAWIGLGALGAPMGRATPAAAARDAAGAAAVVGVMVAAPSQLESALTGEDGIVEALRPPTSLLVMSAVDHAAIEASVARLEGVTAHVVDAPVCGGA